MPLVFLLGLLIHFRCFVLYGWNKAKSKGKGNRIPKQTLLWVVRLGGGVGCWIGMMLFLNKTKHKRFMIFVPLWIVLWAIAVVLRGRYW